MSSYIDLVNEVAKRTGISQFRARSVIRTLVEVINERVTEGSSVRVYGLGTFKRRVFLPRSTSPFCEESSSIPPRWVVKFVPSTLFKKLLAEEVLTSKDIAMAKKQIKKRPNDLEDEED